MGELHLEVYVERMRREYGVDLVTVLLKLLTNETITKKAEFDYTHKKQTGGQGQFSRVAGYLEPIPLEEGKELRVRRQNCGWFYSSRVYQFLR